MRVVSQKSLNGLSVIDKAPIDASLRFFDIVCRPIPNFGRANTA